MNDEHIENSKSCFKIAANCAIQVLHDYDATFCHKVFSGTLKCFLLSLISCATTIPTKVQPFLNCWVAYCKYDYFEVNFVESTRIHSLWKGEKRGKYAGKKLIKQELCVCSEGPSLWIFLFRDMITKCKELHGKFSNNEKAFILQIKKSSHVLSMRVKKNFKTEIKVKRGKLKMLCSILTMRPSQWYAQVLDCTLNRKRI